jgi:hypothetical protein
VGKGLPGTSGSDELGLPPVYELYRATDGARTTSNESHVTVNYHPVQTADPSAKVYRAEVKWDGTVAVEVFVHIVAGRNTVHIQLTGIREHPPYQCGLPCGSCKLAARQKQPERLRAAEKLFNLSSTAA